MSRNGYQMQQCVAFLSFTLGIRGKMLLLAGPPLGYSLHNSPLYVLTEFSRISEETKPMVLKGSQTDVSEGSGRLWSFARCGNLMNNTPSN